MRHIQPTYTVQDNRWEHRKPFAPHLNQAQNHQNKMDATRQKAAISTITSSVAARSTHPWNQPQRIRVQCFPPHLMPEKSNVRTSHLNPSQPREVQAGRAAHQSPRVSHTKQRSPNTSQSLEDMTAELNTIIMEDMCLNPITHTLKPNGLHPTPLEILQNDLLLSSSNESLISEDPQPTCSGTDAPQPDPQSTISEELLPSTNGPTPSNVMRTVRGDCPTPNEVNEALMTLGHDLLVFVELSKKVSLPVKILQDAHRQLDELMTPLLVYHKVKID